LANENDQDGDKEKGAGAYPFVVVWAGAAFVHFILMFPTSCIIGVFPEWLQTAVVWVTGAFAIAAEQGLSKVINYRGQDKYQWPIMIGNSVLYGLLFAFVWRWYAQRQVRRGFEVESPR
jgi:cytochrome c biogenesis protein CcdA